MAENTDSASGFYCVKGLRTVFYLPGVMFVVSGVMDINADDICEESYINYNEEFLEKKSLSDGPGWGFLEKRVNRGWEVEMSYVPNSLIDELRQIKFGDVNGVDSFNKAFEIFEYARKNSQINYDEELLRIEEEKCGYDDFLEGEEWKRGVRVNGDPC
ncbi:hypothetical protein GOV12_08010 [Candidatus Pacearchaeota archaeon]|nr:hypothetical protein [Candidatus Pacearchaeota archaeon]